MPPTITNEREIGENVQVHQVFKQVSEEAIQLRITEKFLSEIEKRILKFSAEPFNLQIVKSGLQKLKELPKDSLPINFLQLEFQIKQEFQTWRKILKNRDSKIETYNLRRFCDTTQEPLEKDLYLSLARFYYSLEQSDFVQSKFDLVMTRFYALERGQAYRTLQMDRESLTKSISELYDKWNGRQTNYHKSSQKIAKIVTQIDEFIYEAQTLIVFDDLIKCNLFERFRNFKQQLKQNFYHPEVLAVAIECNLMVGNTFHSLLGNANENLSLKLNSAFDFAGAFHDTSPNALIHTSEILNEVKKKNLNAENSLENEELNHIWDLLENIVIADSEAEDERLHNLLDDSLNKKSLPPLDRIELLSETLKHPHPNVKLLREYMKKYEVLRQLDLNDFFGFPNKGADELSREALHLIIWSEEIRENELNQPQNIPLTIRDEVMMVVSKSKSVNEKLKLLTEVSDIAVQNKLLIVSNKLLEFSLKLERAIIKLSNRNLGISKNITTENKKDSQVVVKENIETQQTKREKREFQIIIPDEQKVKSSVVYTHSNRWLILFLLLMALGGGVIYYVTNQIKSAMPMAQDVEKIETKNLPKGELFNFAYRKKNTLFVVSNDKWGELSKGERDENMKNLLNSTAKDKIDNVVVSNAEGKTLGTLTTAESDENDIMNLTENLLAK